MEKDNNKIVSTATLWTMIATMLLVAQPFLVYLNATRQINVIWYYVSIIPIIPSFLLFVIITLKENKYISRRKMLKGLFMAIVPIANIVYILIEGFFLLADTWTHSTWLEDNIIGSKSEPTKLTEPTKDLTQEEQKLKDQKERYDKVKMLKE